jgi:hypothetical protein
LEAEKKKNWLARIDIERKEESSPNIMYSLRKKEALDKPLSLI